MLRRTVKCRLDVTPEECAALRETLLAFASACNHALMVANETGRRRAYDLQRECYREIRGRFGLKASHAVRAIARVAQSFGRKRPPREFRPTSLDLDHNLFSYNPHTETVSVSSVRGRLKGVKLRIGEYQRRLLAGQTPKAGALVHDARRGGRFFIHFVTETTTPVPGGRQPLGVDLGINRIITTSDGEIISGRGINRRRERYARTRSSLQSKGTRGARRTLKRLGGRQARFMRDVNHKLSNRLVAKAEMTESYLVLEDLSGIRERIANRGRYLRRAIGGWSFRQLRTFIAYKAQLAGVPVVLVDPRDTSKTCSSCGQIGSRRKHKFSCESCGHIQDSDLNAALNIAARGATVYRPESAPMVAAASP